MSRRRRNHKPEKSEPIKNGEVFHTHGGRVVRGKISIQELIESVKTPDRPEAPWNPDETHRRWNDSVQEGHRQLFFKCQNCSLEFSVLSFRSEIEALEAFRPSHGEQGGLCPNVCCPECGKQGLSFMLGQVHVAGPIYGFVNRSLCGGKSA